MRRVPQSILPVTDGFWRCTFGRKTSANCQRGFTLLELMIAIGIVAITSTVGLYIYTNALAKVRDAKRKSDLKQIQTALQAYYNDTGHYPVGSGSGGWANSCAPSCASPSSWYALLPPQYIKQMPLDPKNNGDTGSSNTVYSYDYWGGTDCTGFSSYILFTRLENTNDSSLTINGSPLKYGSDGSCSFPDPFPATPSNFYGLTAP